jgi:hypothetical protein
MQIYGGNHIRVILPGLVYLEDGPGPETIAMDPDKIIQDIKKLMPLKNLRIIYRDEYGDFDELIIENDYFSLFRRISPADPDLIRVKFLLNRYHV